VKSRIAIAAALTAAALSAGTAAADPAPPPPPPGPKTSIDTDGTYTVGTDIAPGVYQSAGPVEGSTCYWKRSKDSDIVDNAMTKKAQIVQIDPSDTSFTTHDCQQWQKTDATPPGPGNPADLLGQLGTLIGKGMLTGPGAAGGGGS
jgi:hypothetical protein